MSDIKNSNTTSKKEKKILTKKQKLVTASIVVLCVLALAAILAFGVPYIVELLEANDESDYVFLYPADYGENIFDDRTYMNKSRDLFYTENDTGMTVTSETEDTFTGSPYFFIDYFNAAINGDAELYASFFDTERYTGPAIPEKFTMQKIYDMDVKFVEVKGDASDAGVTYEFYEVRYKILYNNGTLRNDISSKEVLPLMYTLMTGSEGTKIIAIEKITYEYE